MPPRHAKCINTIAENYKSNSQKARILTENWVKANMFCPRCGNLKIEQFSNNKPVADFYCASCESQFELKSKSGELGDRINDGAYNTMISRINGNSNPDFFFLSYMQKEQKVNSFVVIPKHFFVPDIIEKRKPLSETARRSGWVGCNIILNTIPSQGRIFVVWNGIVKNKENVIAELNRSCALEMRDIASRGWLFDVLNCVNNISNFEFTLDNVYEFEHILSERHPDNNNVKAKIRQQLQFLRDKGYIEFLTRGRYRKI